MKKLYEGKAKILYEGEDAETIIQYFKDDATAFNAQKRGTILQKGVLNNAISSQIFQDLEKVGIATHFIRQQSEREMVVRRVTIIPLEVVVRNVIAGSLAKRMGREEGEVLPYPIVEFYYKDDALGDPLVTNDHIAAFKLATPQEVTVLREEALKVNQYLVTYFDQRGILLVDFKLEFGKTADGKILLADEITPDGCRLWDKETREKLDKDRFRRDLGGVEEAYQRIWRMVCKPESM